MARRLAITRQHLAGPRRSETRQIVDASSILDLVRDLGCVQLDPTSAVARSHLLVLWSRLGPYDPMHLDTLLWQERQLFEYWAHEASIVLTEDYPLHHLLMRKWGTGESPWVRRVQTWMKKNDALRRHILNALRRGGPLSADRFEDHAVEHWTSTGWTAGRNVSRMREIVRRAAQKSLRALGVARARQIEQHFIRGRYPGLPRVLADFEAEGRIQRVQIGADGREWPGPWYIHTDDLPLLNRLAAGDWQPRTTLLSPFDNLICDRARTEKLFGFTFRMEIYVPPTQRRYGYYVMPILSGDRLIGRSDLRMDRAQGRLMVNAVYAEPDAPRTRTAGRALAGAIEDLAEFLGARDIRYGRRVPRAWKRTLR